MNEILRFGDFKILASFNISNLIVDYLVDNIFMLNTNKTDGFIAIQISIR